MGMVQKGLFKKISVDAAKEIKIELPQGDYTITVKDRVTENSLYKKDIFIRADSKNKKLSFRTNFGQVYDQEENNNFARKIYPMMQSNTMAITTICTQAALHRLMTKQPNIAIARVVIWQL